MAAQVANVQATIRAARFHGGLRPRIVGRAESIAGLSWVAVLLEEGTGVLHGPKGDRALAAPLLAWQPWEAQTRLTLAPGADGFYILIGGSAMTNAVGFKPESRELREMAGNAISLRLERGGAGFARARHCFATICDEVGAPGPAGPTVIESFLRVLLVDLWRSRNIRAETVARASPSQRIFARFIEMVEAQFRERRTVNAYAARLGVSRDRLGDICMRVRGMGPKTLIDRRVLLEASLLLENSSYSIEQIAGQLGFQSASQFNRFFARNAGRPPGRFRDALWQRSAADRAPRRQHEWP